MPQVDVGFGPTPKWVFEKGTGRVLPDGTKEAVIRNSSTGERFYKRTKVSPETGKQVQVGELRRIRSLGGEAAVEAAGGAGGALAGFGVGKGMNLIMGVGGLAADGAREIYEEGQRQSHEAGWEPRAFTNPVSAFESTMARGVLGYGEKLTDAIGITEADEPPDPRLNADQVRAVERMPAYADEEERERVIKAALGKTDYQRRHGKSGVGRHWAGENEGKETLLGQALPRGKNILSLADRTAWGDELAVNMMGGRGDRRHFTPADMKFLAGANMAPYLISGGYGGTRAVMGMTGNAARKAANQAVNKAKDAVGKKPNPNMRQGVRAAGRNQGGRMKAAAVATGLGTAGSMGGAYMGPVVWDQFVHGGQKNRDNEETYRAAQTGAAIFGSTVPFGLGVAGRGVAKGVGKLRQRGERLIDEHGKNTKDKWNKPEFTDMGVVAAKNDLAAKGINIPTTRAEDMGQVGADAVSHYTREHPHFIRDVRHALGGRQGQIEGQISKHGSDADAANAALRVAKHMSDDAINTTPKAQPNKIRQALVADVERAREELSAGYTNLKNTAEFKRGIARSLFDQEAVEEAQGYMKGALGRDERKADGILGGWLDAEVDKIGLNTTAKQLFEMRKAVRERRREYWMSGDRDKYAGRIQRGLGKIEDKLTEMIGGMVGSGRAKELADLDAAYAERIGKPMRAGKKLTYDRAFVEATDQHGETFEKMYFQGGRVNMHNYDRTRSQLERAGDTEAVEELDNLLAQKLVGGIKPTSADQGKQIVKVINDNENFFSQDLGDRVYNKMTRLIGGRLADIVEDTGNLSVKKIQSGAFLNQLRSGHDAQVARRLFGEAFGGKDNGDNVLKFLYTQHLLRAKNPSAFMQAHRGALRELYDDSQIDAMENLSVLYGNIGRFKLDEMVRGDKAMEQLFDSIPSILARKSKEDLGQSIQSLVSTMKMFLLKQVGSAYVVGIFGSRFAMAHDSKRVMGILLSEAGKNPEVAKAWNKGNFQMLDSESLNTLGKRITMGWAGATREPTEEDRLRLDVERSNPGGGMDADRKLRGRQLEARLKAIRGE